MIYTTIISLLIEKQSYLLRPKSIFISNSVRVYRYICEIFQLNVLGVGLLTLCFVLRGGFLYRMIVPGEGFCSLQVVSQGGVVMDETDTCIIAPGSNRSYSGHFQNTLNIKTFFSYALLKQL